MGSQTEKAMKSLFRQLLLLILVGESLGDECSNPELAVECIHHCGDFYDDCLNSCTDETVQCELECSNQLTDCLFFCPCQNGCPVDCTDCQSPFCKDLQCRDPETNDDYLTCKKHFELLYNTCIISCPPGDFECFSVCSRDYQSKLETCPCESGCPQGCPCPEYQCPSGEPTTTQMTTTTTAATNNMAMLFLSTSEFSNNPRLIETSGEVLTSFRFGGKEVFASCGVTFQNKYFIFGGLDNKRQILQINDCSLTSVGLTPFEHFFGACGSTDTMVILCFNDDKSDNKRCRQTSSPTGPWTQMALSTYDHRETSIASSQDEFLVVGSDYPENKKAELYNFDTDSWNTVADYPFGSGSDLSEYDMLYIP